MEKDNVGNNNEGKTGSAYGLMFKAVIYIFFVFMIFVYIRTAAPAFSLNDSPETAAAAVSLGIGHAPAYPLYMLAGKAALLFLPGNPAFALSVFSTVMAAAVLVFVFVIAKRYSSRFALYAPVLLAFISTFWEQASDAKGGIYILNLLLLSMQLLALDTLIKKYGQKCFLFIMYTYGLSLANHWPSAAIMVFIPLGAMAAVAARKKYRHMAAGVFFVLLGLTPYIYLPVRALAGPAMNMENPADIGSILSVIFRRVYSSPLNIDLSSVVYQTKAVFLFFASSLSVFALIPLAALFKKSSGSLTLPPILFITALVDIIAIAVFNRTSAIYEDLIGVFLLPSCLTLCALTPAGIEMIADKIKGRLAGRLLIGALIVIALAMGAEAYISSDRGSDYLGYDIGMNIIKTAPLGVNLIVIGDYNVFAAQYLQIAAAKRPDLRIKRCGNADFTGKIGLPAYSTISNEKNIQAYAGDFKVRRQGILFELLMKTSREIVPDGYQWLIYSYRGMIGGLLPRDSMENFLLSYYSSSMLFQAEEYAGAGMTEKAKRMLNMSLAIKGFKSAEAIKRSRGKIGI
jgi:hypothetical protein